jgi:hypothetical protein
LATKCSNNLKVDNKNCGKCGNICTLPSKCTAGVCRGI